MKYSLILVVCLCFTHATHCQQEATNYATDRIVLKVINNTDMQSFCRSNLDTKPVEIRSIRKSNSGDTYSIIFDIDMDIESVITRLKKKDEIIFIEPDYIGTTGGEQITIPSDTYFETRQWGLYNTGTFSLATSKVDADIDMELAWDFTTGDENIVIAILDSGLKLDHPDISDNLWYNSAESENGSDDDNNGYIDDIHTGWDFVNNDNYPFDDLGHGTNVTGIIGAKGDNDLGYAGVNWNSKLMNLKVINNMNSGLYSWWTEAIYYAVDNGANVINMSLGGAGYSSSMEEAVNYAYDQGVTVVACMMNTNTAAPYYPAAYDKTIAVGATNPNDERTVPFFWNTSSGSNYGSHIDLIAPGNFTYGLSYNSNTNYGTYWGGTSQAAPHVVGVISLLLSIDPDLSVDQLKELVTSTAEDQVGRTTEDIAGFDIYHGHGRLNAYQAILQLTSVSSVNTTTIDDIIIFPNPVVSGTEIEVRWGNIQVQKISILDPLGKLTLSQGIRGNSSMFIYNTELLESGMHIVILETEDSKQYVKRFIINK